MSVGARILRLWPEEPGADRLSASWTLSEFYERYVIPVVREPAEADAKTVAQDRESIRLFEEFTRDPNTGKPPSLERIDQRACARFVAGLKQRLWRGRKLSPTTICKHCIHVQHALDLAGPKSREHRSAAGLLAEVAYFERPAPRDKVPWDAFSLEEIGAFLSASAKAQATANLGGQSPARFWRALWTWSYNTGLRIDATMSATWSMLDAERPNWIRLPAEICKQGHAGQFYVNRWARAAVESLRPRSPRSAKTDDRDAPLFFWRGWPDSASWLQTLRKRILVAAELPENRQFGFHGLRKALGTWLGARNPLIAQTVLGHRGGVTQRCYVSPEAVRELMDQVPQPPQPPAPEDWRQRELF